MGLAQEVATTGVDLLANPGITTPAGFIIAVLIFIANQYFRNRQENRTDAETRGATESGIVETSKAALAVAREQIENMQLDARETRVETKRREREYLKRIEELETQNEDLDNDNRRLRQRLGGSTHALGHAPETPSGPGGVSDATQPYRPFGDLGEGGEGSGGGRRRRHRDEG